MLALRGIDHWFLYASVIIHVSVTVNVQIFVATQYFVGKIFEGMNFCR